MHERARQRELLLHAAGERLGAAIAERLDLFVDRLDELVAFLDRRAEDGREELEIFLNAEVEIERKLSGHVANARSNRPEVAHDVEAEDGRGAFVRLDECCEDS